MNYIVKAAFVSVVLNLVLPLILYPFATEREQNACIKDVDLNIKERFMVMLLHHKHMPVMSSIIIALVITISILIGERI
tara:strand:+ start:1844 stop:2080 length:237 start_codon:yes stop_codon:yes gene_type:complete